MSQIEKRGQLGFVWTASQFMEDARWSATIWGRPELGLLEIPEAITNNSPEKIRSMVDGATERLLKMLVNPPTTNPVGLKHITQITESDLHYQGADLLECSDRMNEAFIRGHWGDGLPLVPPTRAKVDAMVKASGLPADHAVGIFEPGYCIGTVEKIAANAVMAGCRPEAMPIVIAAAECLLDPRLDARLLSMSTSPVAASLLVSGPYAAKIGMNSGVCAIGPGAVSHVNVSIGRTMQLLRMNVGHSYPGVSDMDTQGGMQKFGFCVAENEGRNPWQPFRVDRGYSRDSTTVTLHCVESMEVVHDFANHEPERLIEIFCSGLRNAGYVSIGHWLMSPTGAPGGPSQRYGESTQMILLCPDHAIVFKRAGWSIKDIQQALFKGTRMPFRELMLGKTVEMFKVNSPQLEWLLDHPDTLVPAYKHPGQFEVFVVGGDAGWSTINQGGSYSVTREVRIP
jgi:hypothetical protein